jgi:hypothetical protein
MEPTPAKPAPAPAPPMPKLGTRPRSIDRGSAWCVQPGARPRVGQLVHRYSAEAGSCEVVMVYHLADLAPADGCLVLAEVGIDKPLIPRWHSHQGSPIRNPSNQPDKCGNSWHRLAECPSAVAADSTAPGQIDPYAGWAVQPDCLPLVGAVCHWHDGANDRCTPAYVLGDAPRDRLHLVDPGNPDSRISPALRHNPAPVREALPEKFQPTWHRVVECRRAR